MTEIGQINTLFGQLQLIPLSLASIYGTVKKTPKYKLSKYLEDLIKHREPTTVGAVIYDAMFIVQSLPSYLSLNFGKIAELVLKNICNTQASEVHFVCDSYVKSIKNVEQQARGVNNGLYHITGADLARPKDFRHALRSPKFKNALIKFFLNTLAKNTTLLNGLILTYQRRSPDNLRIFELKKKYTFQNV